MDVATLALSAAGCAERALRLCRGLQMRCRPTGCIRDDDPLLNLLADKFERSRRELLAVHRKLRTLAVFLAREMLELLRGRLNSVSAFFASADRAVQTLVAKEQDAQRFPLWRLRRSVSAKRDKLSRIAIMFDDFERDICSLRAFLQYCENQRLGERVQ